MRIVATPDCGCVVIATSKDDKPMLYTVSRSEPGYVRYVCCFHDESFASLRDSVAHGATYR